MLFAREGQESSPSTSTSMRRSKSSGSSVHAAEVIAAYGGSATEMGRRRDEQCPMVRMGDAGMSLTLPCFSRPTRPNTSLALNWSSMAGGLTVNCVGKRLVEAAEAEEEGYASL